MACESPVEIFANYSSALAILMPFKNRHDIQIGRQLLERYSNLTKLGQLEIRNMLEAQD